MKSKHISSKKVFAPYNNPFSLFSNSSEPLKLAMDWSVDTLIPTSPPLCISLAEEHMPSHIALLYSTGAVNSTNNSNMSMPYVQTGGNNVFIPHGQGMSTSTMGPNIESTVIPYSDNQPADPNLWDGSFSPISIFEVNKSLDKDTKNMALSLQRIRTYIKQHSVKLSSKASIPLDFEPVISLIWQLINMVYELGWEQFVIKDEQSISFNKKMIM